MMINFSFSINKKKLHCHCFYIIIKIYITTQNLSKIIIKNYMVDIMHYVCSHATQKLQSDSTIRGTHAAFFAISRPQLTVSASADCYIAIKTGFLYSSSCKFSLMISDDNSQANILIFPTWLRKKANTPKSFSFFNNTNSCQNGIHGVTEQTEHVYRQQNSKPHLKKINSHFKK